jgi:hypothetical protein
MKRSWNTECDDWTYELEPCDIVIEASPSPEEPPLALVISTAEEEAVYRVIVERN